MDSAKNGRWIIPFKKFSMVRVKVYKAIKFCERKSKSKEMCCINSSFDQLIINPTTFNKYCKCKLLYMIVTHYQNKMLYNKLFFNAKVMALLMFLHIHGTHLFKLLYMIVTGYQNKMLYNKVFLVQFLHKWLMFSRKHRNHSKFNNANTVAQYVI